MNKPKLSIIVPVYNTLPYLEQCLFSLSRQTIPDMEVILVNDGSTDGSDKRLKHQARVDKRFRYIEQENSGLSIARNTGLRIAEGAYLAFLDSDDWLLSDDCLERICRIADRTKPDMITGRTWSVYPDGRRVLWGENSQETLTSGETLNGGDFFVCMQKQGGHVPMVYHYIYWRRFLENHNFSFEPKLIHEDELWTSKALTSAHRVTYTNISHYCYRQREGSIMTTAAAEYRIASLQVIIEKLIEYADSYTNENTDVQIVKEAIRVNILRLYWAACCLCSQNINTELYDKANEMLAVCEQLVYWNQVGKQYSQHILQFIRTQFNELQFL